MQKSPLIQRTVSHLLESGKVKKRRTLKEGFISAEDEDQLLNIAQAGALKKQSQDITPFSRSVSVESDDLSKYCDDIMKPKLQKIKKSDVQTKPTEDLSDKDNKIRFLEERVSVLKTEIANMVKQYYIDVIQFREMRAHEQPEHDSLDIRFFDLTSGLDSETLEILNMAIRDIKLDCEKRMSQQKKVLMRTQAALDRSKEVLQLIMSGDADNTFALFRRVLVQLDNSPYRVVQYLQETIGLKEIFRVFEERKTLELGNPINYEYIDRLIVQSGAGARIIAKQKQEMEQGIMMLQKQLQAEILVMHERREELEQEKNKIEKTLAEQYQFELSRSINELVTHYSMREKKIIAEHEMKLAKLQRFLSNNDEYPLYVETKLRFSLMQWYFSTKMECFRKQFFALKDKEYQKRAAETFKRMKEFDLEVGSENVEKSSLEHRVMGRGEGKAIQDIDNETEIGQLKSEHLLRATLQIAQNKLKRIEQNLDLERAKRDIEKIENSRLRQKIELMQTYLENIFKKIFRIDQPIDFSNKDDIQSKLDHINWSRVSQSKQQQEEIVSNFKQLSGLSSQQDNKLQGLKFDRSVNTRIMGVRENLGALEEQARLEFDAEEDIYAHRVEDWKMRNGVRETQTQTESNWLEIMGLRRMIKKKKSEENQEDRIQTDDLEIFIRLYQESKSREQRRKILTKHVHNIEQDRWQEVLEPLNLKRETSDIEVYHQTKQMLEKHKLLKSRDYLKSRFHLMAMERSRHNLGTSTTPEQIRSQTPNTVVKRKIEKDTELADDFTATVCNKKFEKLKDRIYRIRTKKKIDGLATLAEDGITFDISAKYLKQDFSSVLQKDFSSKNDAKEGNQQNDDSIKQISQTIDVIRREQRGQKSHTAHRLQQDNLLNQSVM